MLYTTRPRDIPPYKQVPCYTEFGFTDPEPVFLYDELDSNLNGIELEDAFTSVVWAELRTNPRSRLLINFIGDFLNLHDISKFKRALERHKVPSQSVWITVMDANVVDFVREHLPYVHCQAYNLLMYRVEPQTIRDSDPNYRFSILSRNYRPWRLEFYLGLLKAGVLERSVYSFHNIDPYNQVKPSYSIHELISDAQSAGYTLEDQDVQRWLSQLPYNLPGASKYDKHNTVTTDTIRRAGVHLLIESHWDPFYYWANYRGMDPREFSPGFPTEKTYKAIACARPFIAVSTPYFLESLKRLGFKTFSPWIDESYDREPDNSQRMRLIIKEAQRINGLSQEEYRALLAGTARIALENYYHFQQLQKEDTLTGEWAWLKEYIK